jgi:hypothetical protein
MSYSLLMSSSATEQTAWTSIASGLGKTSFPNLGRYGRGLMPCFAIRMAKLFEPSNTAAPTPLVVYPRYTQP